MKVAVSGASGLVGSAVCRELSNAGHDVFRLVRRAAKDAAEICWDPIVGAIEVEKLEGLDGVIHLAGENIAGGRWTAARKLRIYDSRVKGAQFLCETLAKLRQPPKVLVSASAIGFYGDRGDEPLAETSAVGKGFLAEVCRDWESATQSAIDKGIRVVQARIGVVLSTQGGALAKMLLPFKLGVGGVVGAGNQYMSWIALDDLAAVLVAALTESSWTGPINAVAPNPVTNREFTKALGRALGRPTIFPMPAFAARLAFGEMADALLLASTRVIPKKLRESNFNFKHPDVHDALQYVLRTNT